MEEKQLSSYKSRSVTVNRSDSRRGVEMKCPMRIPGNRAASGTTSVSRYAVLFPRVTELSDTGQKLSAFLEADRNAHLEPEGVALRLVLDQGIADIFHGQNRVPAEVDADLGPNGKIAAAIAVSDHKAVLVIVRGLLIEVAV